MISTFLDGPAAYFTPRLVRAPIMLLVGMDMRNLANVYTSPDMAALAGEHVYVYIAVAGTWRTCGLFESCTYRLLPTQPDQEHLRQGKDFRAWCELNKERLMGEHHNWRPPEGTSPQAKSFGAQS